jgi:SAM-dependent methyltransferase
MTTANPEALGVEVQPDDRYFDIMAEVSETHWWYRARREWLRQALGPAVARGERAYDIGCGTGDAMATLADLGAAPVAGTDLSEHVLRWVVQRDDATTVLEALAEQLPFASGSAATLISMDVIEHLDDDVVALREYRRLLRPGGTVFLTVPAYQWIWSEHDERAAHRRRYSRQRFVTAVRAAGFEVDRVTYFFSFLVPVAALVRKTPLRRFFPATDEEASEMHPAIDKVLAILAGLERRVGARLDLPFGLSILLVGHVPEDDAT